MKWFRAVSLLLVLSGHSAFGLMQLQFWHSMSGDKGKLLQEIVDDFNGRLENKGVRQVQLQFIGTYEDGLNKLRTALMVKRGPHVVQITDIGSQIMMDSGAVAPLHTFFQGDAEFPYAQILPQIRRYYEVNGKLFSLPFATSNPIIYYNVDAFQKAGIAKPPATFAELTEIARKLTDAKTKTTGVTWPLHSWFFEQFLARQGALLVNHENGRKGRATESLLTSPEALAVVQLWATMVKEGTFANVGRGWEPAEQNFLAGRTAMLITSTSDVFEVAKKAPFKVMTAPLPGKDANSRGGTIIGGNSLWILNNKPAEEQKAAYAFVKFMASKEVQRKWHSNTGYFPIRTDLINDLEKEGFYKKYPAAWTPIQQLRASPEIAATQGALMGVFPEAREHIESAIEEIISGKSDAPAALSKAKTQTDEALVRYTKSHKS